MATWLKTSSTNWIGTGTGTWNGWFDTRGRVKVYLESQNYANNSSYIRLDYYAVMRTTETQYGMEFNGQETFRANQGSYGGSYQTITSNKSHFTNTETEKLLGSKYFTVYHNTDGTGTLYYNGNIDGTISEGGGGTFASGQESLSSTVELPRLSRYATITSFSVVASGMTSINFNFTTDVSIDAVEYSFGGGWITASSLTIGSLNPATVYTFKIRVKRTDSQLWTESATLYVQTFDIVRIINLPEFNIGSNLSITSNNNNGIKADLIMFVNGLPNIVIRSNITTANYTFVFTQDEINAMYSALANTNKAVCTIYVNSYENNAYIGQSNISTFCNVINANPVFTNFTYEDINTTTIALTGSNQKIVKGYSNVKAIVSVSNKAIAQKYATMSKYRFVIGGKQVDGNYSDDSEVNMTLNAIDNNIFNVYAIDSRNNSTVKQLNPSTYIDYFNPYFDTPLPIAEREDGIGSSTTLTINGKFFNSSFGNVTNDIFLTYKYKKTEDTNYTDGTSILTITKNGNIFSFTGLIAGDLGASGFDTTYSYNIQIIATDSLSTITYDFILGTGTPNLAIHSDGISVNSPYIPENGGDLQIGGINVFELMFPIGTGFTSYDDTDYSSRFGFGWEKTCIGRVPVGKDATQTEFDTLGETGGSKYIQTHTHQISTDGTRVQLRTNIGSGGGVRALSIDGSVVNGNTLANGMDVTTGNSGNLQPYQVVNFWKRVS